MSARKPSAPHQDPYTLWPRDRVEDMHANAMSGRVGTVLVSETDSCRVWHLTIAPGGRLPFHRHVLDYFWTVLSNGTARSYYEGGAVREMSYRAGDTRHFTFSPGEHMVHNLENIGEETLVFVTVEWKTGRNAPLVLTSGQGD